jgi:hypothetical protein
LKGVAAGVQLIVECADVSVYPISRWGPINRAYDWRVVIQR